MSALSDGLSLDLAIDVDVGQARTGVIDPGHAVTLAKQIAPLPNLRFVGIQGYAGHAQHVATFACRPRFPKFTGIFRLRPRSIAEPLHPQFDSVFWSIASTERGEIPSSTNPGISGDDTVSICISST